MLCLELTHSRACDRAGRTSRDCVSWVLAGHIASSTEFFSCDQCGINKISQVKKGNGDEASVKLPLDTGW